MFKIHKVEEPLYVSGSTTAQAGMDEGREVLHAIYMKDGCLYVASHVELPSRTAVSGRRLRKPIWQIVYARIGHLRRDAYEEAAAFINEISCQHGQCWTVIYKGSDGSVTREFLDDLHEKNGKKIAEDPDLAANRS